MSSFDGTDPIIDVAPAEVRAVKLFVLVSPKTRATLKSDATPLTITALDVDTSDETSRVTAFRSPEQ